jgi:uncharacterized protein YegP (UPF0339 family)
MQFELFHVDDIETRFYWRATTSGGRILAWSENYPTKQDCIEAIERLQASAAGAPVIDRTTTDETPD